MGMQFCLNKRIFLFCEKFGFSIYLIFQVKYEANWMSVLNIYRFNENNNDDSFKIIHCNVARIVYDQGHDPEV